MFLAFIKDITEEEKRKKELSDLRDHTVLTAQKVIEIPLDSNPTISDHHQTPRWHLENIQSLQKTYFLPVDGNKANTYEYLLCHDGKRPQHDWFIY